MKAFYITNSFAHTGGGLVGAVSGLVHGVDDIGLKARVSAYQDGDVAHDWSGLSLRPIVAKRLWGVHFGGDLHHQLSDFDPDIVHSHGLWLRASQVNYQWCSQSKIPYVISPHGMLDPWAVSNSAWKKKLAGVWFEHRHMNGASCLHALCDSEAASIRKFGQKNPICVIPNGIRLPSAPTGKCAPWNSSRERKTVLFIGRLHPKKGLPLLLSAWAKMKEEVAGFDDSWYLAIAGWSEVGHREELERQVKELDLQDAVEFLGPLHGDEKVAALESAQAFVLPSYSEGLPMSILEAWSYRLPVLMTPECNLPEGFKRGAALRCETNIQSIQACLSELHTMSDQDRASMGEDGYDLVKEKFVWRRIAEQMHEVYQWVLGEGELPECIELR